MSKATRTNMTMIKDTTIMAMGIDLASPSTRG
jgi:hypothetical protein